MTQYQYDKLALQIERIADAINRCRPICRDSVVELKTISGATVFIRASRITWVQVNAKASGFTIQIDGRDEQGQITNESAVAAVAAMRRLCGEKEGNHDRREKE